jgi:hypothetical protein
MEADQVTVDDKRFLIQGSGHFDADEGCWSPLQFIRMLSAKYGL